MARDTFLINVGCNLVELVSQVGGEITNFRLMSSKIRMKTMRICMVKIYSQPFCRRDSIDWMSILRQKMSRSGY